MSTIATHVFGEEVSDAAMSWMKNDAITPMMSVAPKAPR
jgi:hypothetical protein